MLANHCCYIIQKLKAVPYTIVPYFSYQIKYQRQLLDVMFEI